MKTLANYFFNYKNLSIFSITN